MSDFQNQGETPYYELYPSSSYPQNDQTPFQPSHQVIQMDKNYGSDAIYKTPCYDLSCYIFIIWIFAMPLTFFLVITFFYILDGYFDIFILFLLIPSLIAFIIGSIINTRIIINISSTLGIITIQKKKLFCCFNKQEIIKLNDIKQVSIKKTLFGNYFEIFFKLIDEKEVKACPKIENNNGEKNKAINIIKNALPQRIEFLVK